jgi:DNA-binding NarL/FixJ family response regulator
MMRVLGLVRDLMFRSKIDAGCEALGVEVAYASSLEAASARCAELKPSVVMVDLSEKNFAAEPTMAALREAAPGARVIGFASHVDLKALAGAREAGFERVLSRSEFAAQIPALLAPHPK